MLHVLFITKQNILSVDFAILRSLVSSSASSSLICNFSRSVCSFETLRSSSKRSLTECFLFLKVVIALLGLMRRSCCASICFYFNRRITSFASASLASQFKRLRFVVVICERLFFRLSFSSRRDAICRASSSSAASTHHSYEQYCYNRLSIYDFQHVNLNFRVPHIEVSLSNF